MTDQCRQVEQVQCRQFLCRGKLFPRLKRKGSHIFEKSFANEYSKIITTSYLDEQKVDK